MEGIVLIFGLGFLLRVMKSEILGWLVIGIEFFFLFFVYYYFFYFLMFFIYDCLVFLRSVYFFKFGMGEENSIVLR